MKQAGTCSLGTSKLGQSGELSVVSEDLADIWLILGGLSAPEFLVYFPDIDNFFLI